MTPVAVFVVGPTASGKTDLAIRLAQHLKASIVNADSIQLYADLEVGSSAPTASQKALVPHELFQVIPPGETWTVGEYEQHAWPVIEGHLKQGRSVVIAGGSGFYVQALDIGVSIAPPDDPKVRAQVEERLKAEGASVLYEELKTHDPKSAAIIHPHDHYRLIRALSYFHSFGRPFSLDKDNESPRKWPARKFKLGLTGSQADLKKRIEARTAAMLSQGLIEEVEGLLQKGHRDWWPMKSVGYLEVVRMLEGELAQDKLSETIVQKTLSLAKKQKTWFQRDPEIQWFGLGETEAALKWFKNLTG